jgi:hypothetical protein
MIEEEQTKHDQNNTHDHPVAHRLCIHPLDHFVQTLIHLRQGVRGKDEQ